MPFKLNILPRSGGEDYASGRRDFLRKSALMGGLAICSEARLPFLDPSSCLFSSLRHSSLPRAKTPSPSDSGRPKVSERTYFSRSLEANLASINRRIHDTELRRLFNNTYPQTLDSLILYNNKGNRPDTFIYADDGKNMSLSASCLQVFRYIELAKEADMSRMLQGLIRRQTELILNDCYGLYFSSSGESLRKSSDSWTIDNLCYPLHLAYQFWKATGGHVDVFDARWMRSLLHILEVVEERMVSLEGNMDLSPTREATRQFLGERFPLAKRFVFGERIAPGERPALLSSVYSLAPKRTLFPLNIPLNIMLSRCLEEMTEMASSILKNPVIAGRAHALNDSIKAGLRKHATQYHARFGRVYAWEVDRVGNQVFQEQANAQVHGGWADLGIQGFINLNDPVYRNTVRAAYSPHNAYFKPAGLEKTERSQVALYTKQDGRAEFEILGMLMEAGGNREQMLNAQVLKSDLIRIFLERNYRPTFDIFKQMSNTEGFFSKYGGSTLASLGSKESNCYVSNSIFSEIILTYLRTT